MKIFVPLISAFVFLATGCQRTPPPAPSTATLLLNVIAEPKAGVTEETYVDSYGNVVGSGVGAGKFERFDYSALDDIVVWLEPAAPAANPPPPADLAIDIDVFKPAPELNGALCVGQKLILHNAAARPINLYSASDGNDFDLGVIQPGASAEYTVRSPGLIEILTDSLQLPVATVYVAPTPIFRMTQSGKIVEFRDLPPGQYKIVSWHPRLPGHEITITLPQDQITSASIKVTVNGLPLIETR